MGLWLSVVLLLELLEPLLVLLFDLGPDDFDFLEHLQVDWVFKRKVLVRKQNLLFQVIFSDGCFLLVGLNEAVLLGLEQLVLDMDELLLRLLVGQLEVEIHIFLLVEQVVGLLLSLLDEVLVVFLAVDLCLFVFFLELNCELLVLVHFLFVLLLYLLQVGDDRLLWDELVAVVPDLLHLL